MFKERFFLGGVLTGVVILFCYLTLSPKYTPSLDEYEQMKVTCSELGGVESYYSGDSKINVYCYDGSIVWVDRG